MATIIHMSELPPDCIVECSAPGPADAAVDYWLSRPEVREVIMRAPADDLRDYLRDYGAWDDEDLEDDETNRQRLLWLACGDFAEHVPGEDGDSAAGSDVVWID